MAGEIDDITEALRAAAAGGTIGSAEDGDE